MTNDDAPVPEAAKEDRPEETTGSAFPTDEDLDDMTGGLNLVNKASCSTAKGSLNTVVSVGQV